MCEGWNMQSLSLLKTGGLLCWNVYVMKDFLFSACRNVGLDRFSSKRSKERWRDESMPPDSATVKTSLRRAFGPGGVVTKRRTRHTRICGQALSDNVVARSTQGLWASRKHSSLLQTVKSKHVMCPQEVRLNPERTHVILATDLSSLDGLLAPGVFTTNHRLPS